MNNYTKINNIMAKTGIVLSSVCVIHCLSVPLVLVLMPFFAEFFTETIERWLVLSILPLSIAGFFPTWLKHKNFYRLVLFTISLALIVSAQFLFHTDHNLYSSSLNSLPAAQLMAILKKPIITFIGAVSLAWVTYKNNYHTHVCRNKNHRHQ